MEKRIVILSGAGAAIPWGAPRTKAITETICEDTTFKSRTGQPLGEWFYNKLVQHYHRDPDSVNFETILNSVDWLCSFFDSELRQSISKFKTQLPVFLKEKDEVYEVLDFGRIYDKRGDGWQSHNDRLKLYNFWDDYDDFFESVFQFFVNLIVAEVEKYEQECRSNKFESLNNNFNSFLNEYSQEHFIRSYTLNYDRITPLISNLDFFEGFTERNSEMKFDQTRVLKDYSCNSHYNLHGGIHYEQDFPWNVKLNPSKAIYDFGHASTDGNDQGSRKLINSNIITGLNKANRILQNPYSQFYHTFYQDCLQADLILVIGYAFSDTHINKAIMEGGLLNSEHKILCVGWDVYNDEKVENFYPHDFFNMEGRDAHAFIGNSHGIHRIRNKGNKGKVFNFRKGFEKFLEWRIWEKL